MTKFNVDLDPDPDLPDDEEPKGEDGDDYEEGAE